MASEVQHALLRRQPELRLPSSTLDQEFALTHTVFLDVHAAQQQTLSPAERTQRWEHALDVITDKRFVYQQVMQNLRPAQYHETIIDKSTVVDDVVLASFSPELHTLITTKQTDTYAAFAMVDYFLRTNRHHLNPEQITEIARLFRPRPASEPFPSYKLSIDQKVQDFAISGKTPEETWVIEREIMDMLEITDHIWIKYLAHQRGKTINITDLMRISSDALRAVHATDTFIGAQQINERDRLLFLETESLHYRNLVKESVLLGLSRPDVLLSMLISPRGRNFAIDFQRLLRLPDVLPTQGLEHIPYGGPVIIAFSHMNSWRDPTIPPNWELTSLIGTLRRRRYDAIGLMAYLSYFQETAPPILQNIARRIINETVKRAKSAYGIHFLEVKPKQRTDLLHNTIEMLDQGHVVLIAPEGAAAKEIIRPKRGLGTIARISEAPVIGVAFREDQLPDGHFKHTVIFTPPQRYSEFQGNGSQKDQDQQFADQIMRSIAMQLPEDQRGIFRFN